MKMMAETNLGCLKICNENMASTKCNEIEKRRKMAGKDNEEKEV